MNSERLGAHGLFDLSIEGKILRIDAQGPGNREMVIDYHKKALELVKKLQPHPWGAMVVLTGMPLTPPDGVKMLINGTMDAKRNGMVAGAIVLKDVLYEQNTQNFWDEIYHAAAIEHQIFTRIIDARQWLNDLIAMKTPNS